ncbi:MAG: hypothetical protein JSW51_05530, partial [Gemmatimonadota bacterium]
VAQAKAGRPSQAERALLNNQAGRYDESAWLSVLDTVGADFPEVATAAVERLVRRPDLSAGERGRLLLADGDRWLARGEPDRAAARFEQVTIIVQDSLVTQVALVQLVKAELRTTGEPLRLPALLASLSSVNLDEGLASELRYSALMSDLELAASALAATETTEVPDELTSHVDDLDLFLVAEAMRDSWDAVTLAAVLFREIPVRFPRSPIAPKAILAAAWLDETRTDSLLAVLHSEYPDSPYTLVLSGEADAEFKALEDSLRTLLNSRELPTSNHR